MPTKKYIVIIYLLTNCALVYGSGRINLNKDSLMVQEHQEKWFTGIDVYSGLAYYSLIGGEKIGCHKFSLSLSYSFGSSRVGLYYDYYLSKKKQFLAGVGFHNSFLFDDFHLSRQDYINMLYKQHRNVSYAQMFFLPGRGEVRYLYFFSANIAKEFKLSKRFYLNLKLAAVYGVNPYYNYTQLTPWGGIQLYYEW